MSGSRTALIRWLKFNAVGAVGIGVQLAVLTCLKTGFGLNYLAATVLAVEAAVLHNFFWHERYTWADRRGKQSLQKLFRFNVSNGLISLVGNILMMKLLVGEFGFNYFVANLLSIATCSIINFIVSDSFVFRLAQDQ